MAQNYWQRIGSYHRRDVYMYRGYDEDFGITDLIENRDGYFDDYVIFGNNVVMFQGMVIGEYLPDEGSFNFWSDHRKFTDYVNEFRSERKKEEKKKEENYYEVPSAGPVVAQFELDGWDETYRKAFGSMDAFLSSVGINV